MKKFVLSLGSVAAVVAPVASVISCGDDEATGKTVTLPAAHQVAGSKIDAIFAASSTAKFGNVEKVSFEISGQKVTATWTAKITTAGKVDKKTGSNPVEHTDATLGQVWTFKTTMDNSTEIAKTEQKIEVSGPMSTTFKNAANGRTGTEVSDLIGSIFGSISDDLTEALGGMFDLRDKTVSAQVPKMSLTTLATKIHTAAKGTATGAEIMIVRDANHNTLNVTFAANATIADIKTAITTKITSNTAFTNCFSA